MYREIEEDVLVKHGTVNNLPQKLSALLNQQKTVWELLNKNYTALSDVKMKEFFFDDVKINLQFNPHRIISTSAKVDKKSIENRKCFLCKENIPDEQRAVKFNNEFAFLCNPYPILNDHFTIPHVQHLPQQITNCFESFLDITFSLKDKFTLLYNGPKCGASAPDHLHFQCVRSGVLPIESEIELLLSSYSQVYLNENEIQSYIISDPLRNFIFIHSSNKSKIMNEFERVYKSLQNIFETHEEPLLNVLSFYKDNSWNVIIYPRAKHRPGYYFLEGEDKILISPASIDLCGVLVCPRENDFKKVTGKNIKRIFSEVSLTKEIFQKLK
ncbi:MAG: DUF4922 domain-containing protein [Ignavibacteria bacterium]|jgi:hypothetical protein